MKVRLAGQESESEDEESVCTWNVGCEAAMREDEDGLWAIDSEAPTPDAAVGKWQAEVGDDWVDVDGITVAAASASASASGGLGGAVGMGADGEGGSAALIAAGVAATGAAVGAALGLGHVLTAALVALLVLIYYVGFAGKGRDAAAAAAAAAAAPTTAAGGGGKAPPAALVFGGSNDSAMGVDIGATASAAACAGTYTLMPGMTVHERPVWQHEAGKDLYVYHFNPDLAQTESDDDDE